MVGEPVHNKRYLLLDDGEQYLNVFAFYERMRLSIETFLVHANDVAEQQQTDAYIHAVPLIPPAWCESEAHCTALFQVMTVPLRLLCMVSVLPRTEVGQARNFFF